MSRFSLTRTFLGIYLQPAATRARKDACDPRNRAYLPRPTFNLQLSPCNLQPIRNLQPATCNQFVVYFLFACIAAAQTQSKEEKEKLWRASLYGMTSSNSPIIIRPLNPKSFAGFVTKHTKKCNTLKCRSAGSKASS